MSTHFSIGLITPLILEPLRYYFSTYTGGGNLRWDKNEKVRTIEIEEAFNFNKNSLGEKPRIIVTRGAYTVNKTGLTDSLAQAQPFQETGGRKDFKNMVFYQGMSQITIEARNKGTCELVTDMTAHFLAWTRPMICNTQGFKEFGMPMTVSDCAMSGGEDPEVPKFQTQISLPWMKEEMWQVKNDGITIKDILSTLYKTEDGT